MKIQNIIKGLSCWAVSLTMLAACQSLDEPDNNVPVISSSIVTNTTVGSNRATISIKEAYFTNNGREYEYYLKYSEQSNLGDDANIADLPEYEEENPRFYLYNLKPATTYHYAICVKNNSDQHEVRSQTMTFTTTSAMTIASVDSLEWDEKTAVQFPSGSRYAKEMGALIASRKGATTDFTFDSYSNVRISRSFVGDEETWSLPKEYEFDGGIQYKVIAYSPYSKEVSHKGVEDLYVSLDNPSSYPLWGESEVLTEEQPQAHISLKNMMAKIVLVFRSKASSVRTVISFNLFNAGRKLAGDGWFDVNTGNFTYPQSAYNYDNIANLVSGKEEFLVKPGESYTCEMVALPGKFGSEDVQLETYFKGVSSQRAFLHSDAWESGKTYVYEVAFDDVKLSVSRLYTGITEWKDAGTSDEINVGGKKNETEMINGHEAVDLGLPSGVKWATCNLGASKPEEAGDYYAWGETTTKTSFSYENYADRKISYGSQYNTFPDDISKNEKYDAAYKQWGRGNKVVSRTKIIIPTKVKYWCMPTKADCEELIDKCKWEYYTFNGVKCVKVTGPNGNYIFFPPAGWKSEDGKLYNEDIPDLWTSTIFYDDKRSAWSFFGLGTFSKYSSRSWGKQIRPVYK